MLHIVEQRIQKSSCRLKKCKSELHQASLNFKEIIKTSSSCYQINLAKEKLKCALQSLNSAKHMDSNCRYVWFTNVFCYIYHCSLTSNLHLYFNLVTDDINHQQEMLHLVSFLLTAFPNLPIKFHARSHPNHLNQSYINGSMIWKTWTQEYVNIPVKIW